MADGVSPTPSVVIRIILWILLLAGGTAAGIRLDMELFRDLFFSPLFHATTLIPGLIMMRYAFRAAGNGGRELARSGREGDIPRLETNRLVVSGIYARMRHPMLFGLMLVPMALALMVGSPSYILFIAPAEMAFIALMVLTLEEGECRAKFGEEYKKYAERVPAVCFRAECLKMLFGKIPSNKSSLS